MTPEEVAALRKHLGVSMTRFAEVLGVVKTTVQNWETHGTAGASATLLKLIRDKPAIWKHLTKKRP